MVKNLKQHRDSRIAVALLVAHANTAETPRTGLPVTQDNSSVNVANPRRKLLVNGGIHLKKIKVTWNWLKKSQFEHKKARVRPPAPTRLKPLVSSVI
jgi:hypothetical protein